MVVLEAAVSVTVMMYRVNTLPFISPCTICKVAVPTAAPSTTLVMVGGLGAAAVGVAVTEVLIGPTTVDVKGRIENAYWVPPSSPVTKQGEDVVQDTVVVAPPPTG